MEEPKIEFLYGDGMTGRSYYVNSTHIVTNLGDADQAKELAIKYLKENNLNVPENIIFKWDGTM